MMSYHSRYMTLHRHLVALLFLLLPLFPLHAQLDSLPNIFPAWYTSPDVSRFRGPGLSVDPFINPNLPLSPLNQTRLAHPVAAGIGLTVDLTKSSAFRVSYALNRADYPLGATVNPVHNFSRHIVSLDHLWNLSNHYYGYDPARSWEFLLVTGASYGWAVADQAMAPTQRYWQGQLGFQIRKTLSPHLSAFLEPAYYVAQDKYDFYANGANFDDGVSLKAGLQFRLLGPMRQTPWFDHLFHAPTLGSGLDGLSVSIPTRNAFYFQNLIGWNAVQLKDWIEDDHVFSDYSVNFAIGQWINPAWGYRLGFVDRQILLEPHQYDGLRSYDRQTFRQSFLRLEGVLSIPAFFDRVSFGRVGVDLSGGIEYGIERKYDIQRRYRDLTRNLDHNQYKGISAAMQLKYFLSENVALVGEARYGFFDRRDRIFTPALGIEYYKTPFRRYQTSRQIDPLRRVSAVDPASWFIEFTAGFSKHSDQVNSPVHVAPMGELALGMHFNSYAAARLKEHLVFHPTRGSKRGNFHSELALDYMIDLTNYWMGVNPSRRFSLRPFLGPVYSVRDLSTNKDTESIHRFGFNFGLQHAIAINPNISLFVEPRYLSVLNDYNHWSLSAGVSCMLPKASERRASGRVSRGASTSSRGSRSADAPQQRFSRYYLQIMGGDQFAQAYRWTASEFHGSAEFTVGGRFSQNFALQGSLFYQNLLVDQANAEVDHIYGLRIEGVADLLGLMWPNAEARGYALTTQLGADLALSRNSHTHVGPTAAAQFRRRLGHSPVWFTLQPRLQIFSTNGPNAAMSLSAGLHITL